MYGVEVYDQQDTAVAEPARTMAKLAGALQA